jgi:hypothetical protein
MSLQELTAFVVPFLSSDYGQLGLGDTVDRPTPSLVGGALTGASAMEIVASGDTSYVIAGSSKTVFSMGSGS